MSACHTVIYNLEKRLKTISLGFGDLESDLCRKILWIRSNYMITSTIVFTFPIADIPDYKLKAIFIVDMLNFLISEKYSSF